jgi:hypothetical protein
MLPQHQGIADDGSEFADDDELDDDEEYTEEEVCDEMMHVNRLFSWGNVMSLLSPWTLHS